MGQRSTLEILTTGTNLDLEPAAPAGGLHINLFDQPALPESATAAFTWICLTDPPFARKA
ncbi:hypothetical protein ACLQ29_00050 [Micromonospora sp. DT228]|uniref:hypothetical protein n=1 Tax=Micromonospora sp. DT228 TaxID=3393443 RepID=UPI003CF66660